MIDWRIERDAAGRPIRLSRPGGRRGAPVSRPVPTEGRPPPQTEAAFQRQVLELFERLGWHHRYHTHDSRRSAAGFPDLVLVRGQVLIFAELKSAKGKLRPEQAEWLAALRGAGAEAHVWRPADWERIVAVAQGRQRALFE